MEPKVTDREGQRRPSGPAEPADMDALQASDDFLTAVSQGIDPSGGSDQLAALLLQLRAEVEAPMPAAPDVVGTTTSQADPVARETAFGETPAPTSLDERRAARGRHSRAEDREARRFRTNPWLAGLVGAAAATVFVAGTGAALYNATPESALWGASKAVFGDRTSSVEFASALDEIDSKTQSGDIAGARVLIEQLRDSVKQDRTDRVKRLDRGGGQAVPNTSSTVTASPTQKPEEKPADAPGASTVTVTPAPVTETVTVTETAPAPGGQGTDASSSVNAPSTTSTLPTTTKVLGSEQQTPPAAQSSQ